MEMSIWIAKFLGPVLLATSVPMIFFPLRVRELADGFLKDQPLVYISGILVLLGGLSIVNTHGNWNHGWTLIITLFGWAMVIGGLFRIIVPNVVSKIGGAMIVNTVTARIAGLAWALIGGLLTFKGYV